MNSMKSIELKLGCDHRGYDLAEKIEKWICPIDDLDVDGPFDVAVYHNVGIHENKRTDYNDIAVKLAEEIWDNSMGILVCGSGYGMQIQANRFHNVRAVTSRNEKEIEIARKHNDANVLCLGSDFTDFSTAKKIIKRFLSTKFEKGRHTKRVKKLGNGRGK